MGYIDSQSTERTERIQLVPNEYINVDFAFKAKGKNLIIGTLTNFFGFFTKDLNGHISIDRVNTNFVGDTIYERLSHIIETIDSGSVIDIICNKTDKEYYTLLFDFLCSNNNEERSRKVAENITYTVLDNDGEYGKVLNEYAFNNRGVYDYIFQHPPYMGSKHLNCLVTGLELLAFKGSMTIIEPSTFLINMRETGKSNDYKSIRCMIDGKVRRIDIENYNKAFDNLMYMPYAITYIDCSRRWNEIEFNCCGEHRTVYSVNDCNLIGSYVTVQSILNKCRQYCEHMSDHILKSSKKKKSIGDVCLFGEPYEIVTKSVCNGKYFCEYPKMYGRDGGTLCGVETSGHHYDKMFTETPYGEFAIPYTSAGLHYKNDGDIYDHPVEGDCIYADCKEELNNWKHFTKNSKLYLFITICLTYDQHNETMSVLPWLCDKKYTDEEVFDILGITQNEEFFIDKTLRKFEKHSPWFIRYIRGESFVCNNEIEKYMKDIEMATEYDILCYMRKHGYDITRTNGEYNVWDIYKWLCEEYDFRSCIDKSNRFTIYLNNKKQMQDVSYLLPVKFSNNGSCSISEIWNECYGYIVINDMLVFNKTNNDNAINVKENRHIPLLQRKQKKSESKGVSFQLF